MNLKKDNIFDVVVLSSVAVLSLGIALLYFCPFSFDESVHRELWGQLGDYIGGVVGTIVSLISLIYIYKTYRRQVEFSANEIRLSYTQQFESSLFSLIQHHHTIRQTLNATGEGGELFFEKVANSIKERMMEREYDLNSIIYENCFREEDIASDKYEEVYRQYGDQLEHYFRDLYHIISYVDESKVPDKQKYINIIQGQLSNAELFILFYDGISVYGKKKMYPLLEKYKLLENVFYQEFEYFYLHQSLFYPKTSFKYNQKMQNNIIFLAGVHGVGKSTMFASALKNLPVELLSSSELLKWTEISSVENKKVADISATQNRLIEGLRNAIDYDKRYVLDGHFCLLNGAGVVERIPFETFRAINPAGIVVLTDNPGQIVRRLKNRDKALYSSAMISSFQTEEVAYAKEVSDVLSVPLLEIKVCESSDILFRNFIQETYALKNLDD